MLKFENMVRRAIEGGETVEYAVTPVYNGTNLIPRAVTISAKGSKGFNIEVFRD